MNGIDRTIAKARLRLLAHVLLHTSGWALLLALAGTALLMASSRQGVLASPAGYLYIAVFVFCLLLAWVYALRYQPDAMQVAVRLDTRLALKDRISTALHSSASMPEHPFVKAIVSDAQRAASDARLQEAFPIRPGGVWAGVLAMGCLWAGLYFFLPPGDILGRQDAQQALQRQQQQAAQSSAEIALVNARLTELGITQSQMVDDEPTRLAQELANLSRERLESPDQRRQAAAQLSDVRHRLQQAQESQSLEMRLIDNAMSRLESETSGPADDFVNSLRRGDYEQAREELQRLAEQLDNQDLSAEEREAMGEQLRNLSTQLQALSASAQRQTQRARQDMAEQLAEAGVSQEQIDQLAQSGFDQQATQQALESHYQAQGMTPEQARQQAEQMAQQMQSASQEAQAQQQAGDCTGGLCDGLGQLAQSASGQPRQDGGSQAGGNGASQSAQDASGPAQQQLNELARMREQLNRLGQAQQQADQAMQRLSEQQPSASDGSSGQQPGPGASGGQAQGQSSGSQWGTGDGGNPYGAESTYRYRQTMVRDIQEAGEGRAIASWAESGEMSVGQATVDYDTSIRQARDDAAAAVTEDRVPQRYHQTIRSYFNQLPESPETIRQPPRAPQ